jgi:hypothetical protein
VANFIDTFLKSRSKKKKLKRHVDARDDAICTIFTAADRIRDIALTPALRRGNIADRRRIDSCEATLNNRVVKRFLA